MRKYKRSSLASQFLVLLNSHHIIVQIEFFILLCLNSHLIPSIAFQLVETVFSLVGGHWLTGFMFLY